MIISKIIESIPSQNIQERIKKILGYFIHEGEEFIVILKDKEKIINVLNRHVVFLPRPTIYSPIGSYGNPEFYTIQEIQDKNTRYKAICFFYANNIDKKLFCLPSGTRYCVYYTHARSSHLYLWDEKISKTMPAPTKNSHKIKIPCGTEYVVELLYDIVYTSDRKFGAVTSKSNDINTVLDMLELSGRHQILNYKVFWVPITKKYCILDGRVIPFDEFKYII